MITDTLTRHRWLAAAEFETIIHENKHRNMTCFGPSRYGTTFETTIHKNKD
ncbi:MAG: hypothetical protein AB7S61_08715 [Methanoregulaceae archaeon]